MKLVYCAYLFCKKHPFQTPVSVHAFLAMLLFMLSGCYLVVHLVVKHIFLDMPVLSLHIIQIAAVHRVHCVKIQCLF